MRVPRFVIINYFIFLFISCSSNTKKNSIETEKQNAIEQKTKLDNKKKDKSDKIEGLIKKYKIAHKLDTTYFFYTFQYDSLIKGKNILIEDFVINDIYIHDGSYFISLRTSNNIEDLTMPISAELVEVFLNENLDNILVISINEFKKIKIAITGEKKNEDEVIVTMDNGNVFLAKGQLIEVLSLTK